MKLDHPAYEQGKARYPEQVATQQHAQAGEAACGPSGDAGHKCGHHPEQMVTQEHAHSGEAACGNSGDACHECGHHPE